jgi:molybdopterin-guanine dinucleotide biosynthesis protein A
MGVDKASLLFRGQPLVAHALDILRGARLDVSIAGSRADLRAYAPVVEDAESGLGPLGGICSALATTAARWAVFLPVDLPLVPSLLVRSLLNHARATGNAINLTSLAGFVQTFPAVLDVAVLPGLKAELEAGRRGCFSAFQAAANGLGQPMSVVAAESLVQDGQVTHPEGRPLASWFSNINSREDLRRAEAHFPGFFA